MESLWLTIGLNIKSIREMNGLTQSELAKEIRCTSATICYLETGHRKPNVKTILDIAVVLDVEITDIIPSKEWYIKNKSKKLKKVVSYEIED